MASRDEHADAVDAYHHRRNLMIALLLGVFACGIVLGAVVGRSPLGALAALVAIGSPWAWMRGDRARVDEIGAEHRGSYAREFGWSVLAIALLAGGYALLIAALVNGW
jgi:hypothetical protein